MEQRHGQRGRDGGAVKKVINIAWAILITVDVVVIGGYLIDYWWVWQR